ncbi:hypothetical protein DAPPUDRAFT_248877 [Daphnia pulex]|uniref:Uncharacterized protein n=1 Tax=Daphnia pulex TaxID=6669 RepID=E9GVD4_DAPPU|nr:hypothetical protein DAPPUDRAFT_248877 [Daphnia pulex]|eukprot:EFX76553.1 hypothetical protein DAPPUDRAFT_248877 [Daphnia pulex]
MTQMSIGIKPIPNNVNLQKERPVSFTLEGHGDHYTHPQQRQPAEGKASFPSIEGHGDHYVSCNGEEVGCERHVLYHYQAAPKYYSSPSFATKAHRCYTNESPKYYTTTYAAPAYYTKAPKYYSAPSYYTEVSEY